MTVPDHVQRLLLERIGGFEELEVLLRFAREPERTWTIAEAEAAAAMSPDTFEEAANALERSRLIAQVTKQPRTLRFSPPSPEVREACEELVRLYERDRFSIVVLMGQLAFERIHRATAQAFADAFVIRKPKKEDDDA